ncbi:sulfatase/phosphatase domain-containing protein [Roseibacillus persicicus]|uniref:sulfatase/phosphatase domain-containing protein n=1 Tax=Roseibacillus persicicus TaxID=454148 RepID=UPI00398B7AB1
MQLPIRPLACLAIATSAAFAAERPNILFLFSDDHACQAISAYPGGILDDLAPTPSIDRIAKDGLLFENSFCTNSICGPSRASILTGKHSHLNGFLDNGTQFDGYQQTFPVLLQEAGYRTAMIGKWHLGTNPVGFDHWEVLPGQGSYYNPDLKQMDGELKRYPGHCNDVVTDIALDQLKKSKDSDKPFMIMAQYKAPHRNWSPALRHVNLFDDVTFPEPDSLFDDYSNRSESLKGQTMSIKNDMYWGHDMKFHGESAYPEYFAKGLPNGEYRRMTDEQKAAWDAAYEPLNKEILAKIEAGEVTDKEVLQWKYQRYIKDYLRSIRSMDEGIGKILDELETSGLADNTIVIYSSDQGFYLGEHGWYDKRWMFEESFKMPFIIRWPGVIKPGTTTKSLIQNIDYAPTFLEVAGAEIPSDIQGKSLVPMLKESGKEPADWRDKLYYRYYGEAVHSVAAHDGIRTDRYKLMYFPETEEYNLFDLVNDPQEMKSVHHDPAMAQIFAEMKNELVATRDEYRASTAVIPVDRNQEDWWKKRQKAKNKQAAEAKHDLIFIGDSITQGWEGKGKAVWEKFYGDRKALNLGFSGDRTEHVLYRLDRGNLRGQQNAKAAVIMIGTNNTGHSQQDPVETADGISRIVSIVRARCPKAQILLLGVFPRGEQPDHPMRKLNVEINKLIAKHDGTERVHFLDIGETFLDENGVLPKSVMPDSLHLNEESYQLWAEAIEPKLKELGL